MSRFTSTVLDWSMNQNEVTDNEDDKKVPNVYNDFLT